MKIQPDEETQKRIDDLDEFANSVIKATAGGLGTAFAQLEEIFPVPDEHTDTNTRKSNGTKSRGHTPEAETSST